MISVVSLTASDCSALVSLQGLLPDADRWSERALQVHLEHPQRLTLGIWQHEQLVAFLLAGWVCDEAELYQIATCPNMRQQGLATQLLDALYGRLQQQGITRLMLEVRQSNEAAQGLYQSLGFMQDGLRKGYYPTADGGVEAALLFSYKISA